MDFRKLLTFESRQEIERQRQILMDFQSKDAPGMARDLLEASRAIQGSGCISIDPRYSYDEWAIYRIIPEMASRLDPSVELLRCEIETPSEKRDILTRIGGVSDKELIDRAQSAISNISLYRVKRSQDDVAKSVMDAAELLFPSSLPSAVSLAADRILPGSFPQRAVVDDRPALEGFQVVCTLKNGRSYAVSHSDKLEEAETIFEAAYETAKTGQILHKGVSSHRLDQLRGSAKRQDIASLKIEDGVGSVLREENPEWELEDSGFGFSV